MLRKLAMAFALGTALLGAASSRASAQTVAVGAYAAGPPVVVEVIPIAPGPDYIWVPRVHRWYPRVYYYGTRFYGRRFERYRYYDRHEDRREWRR